MAHISDKFFTFRREIRDAAPRRRDDDDDDGGRRQNGRHGRQDPRRLLRDAIREIISETLVSRFNDLTSFLWGPEFVGFTGEHENEKFR